MTPTSANGKVCYIEIPPSMSVVPPTSIPESSAWRIRRRGDGHMAFDDTIGKSAAPGWSGVRAASRPGLLVYIMVDDVAASVEAVIARGGTWYNPSARMLPSDREVQRSSRQRLRAVPRTAPQAGCAAEGME